MMLEEQVGIIVIMFIITMIINAIWILVKREYISETKPFLYFLLNLCCLSTAILFNFGMNIILLCLFSSVYFGYLMFKNGEELEQNKKEDSKIEILQ